MFLKSLVIPSTEPGLHNTLCGVMATFRVDLDYHCYSFLALSAGLT